MYGPSTLHTTAGADEAPVTLVQETAYPFDERITNHVKLERPAFFGIKLRVPRWCESPTLSVNGTVLPVRSRENWLAVERRWSAGDVVLLHLPMTLRLARWEQGGVSIERGPIVFSLPVATRWERDHADDRSSDAFPAWNAYPAGPWNFALDVDEMDLLEQIEVEQRPPTDRWWTPHDAPIRLRVPVRPVAGWTLREESAVLETNRAADNLNASQMRIAGNFSFTPPLPDPATLARRLGLRQFTHLVPFGCTRLRMTILPDARVPGALNGN